MVRRLLFMLLLLLGRIGSVSAQQSAMDSLKTVLSQTNDNRQRVDVLNRLSSEIYDTDLNEGYDYAAEAYDHASVMNYERGERHALVLMGYKHSATGTFRDALALYRRAVNVNAEADDLVGYSYVMSANVYRYMADYDSALYYYRQGIGVLEKKNNPFYLAFAYKSLARMLVVQWKNHEAESYFDKAMAIYKQINNVRGQTEILFAYSDVYKNFTEYDKADEFIDKGCTLAHANKSDYLILSCYKSQADALYRRGEYLKSLEVLFKALDILKRKEQPQLLTAIYNQVGEVYAELGQHAMALKYYLDALRITEPIGVRYETAKLYAEIAWIYKNQLNFREAHTYVDKSLKLREAIKDEHGISNCYNVRGVIYYQQKKYDQALSSLQKSLAIRERIGHREGVSACIFNIGMVYEDLGQYDRALEYQFRALKIDERIANNQGLSISYNQIGQLYAKSGRFDEAAEYLNKARNMAEATGSRVLIMNNLNYFSELFKAKGDYKQALDYQLKYNQLHDSVFSENSALKQAEMQALYQAEQKNQEIALLNQNKEIQNNKLDLQRSRIGLQNIIIASALVAILLVALLAYKWWQYSVRIRKASHEILEQKEEIQAQSEELIEANQTIAAINKSLEAKVEDRTSALRQAYKELDTFFYRSSHDFRRPLTTFLGLAEVAKITVKDQNALELFSKVRETASNLDKMLIKLQSISDVGAQELVYKEVMMRELIDNVCDGFADELRSKNITIATDVALKQSFFSYPAMVKIIIENLIENAIFFSTMQEPFINVRAYFRGEEVMLEVEDNGQGIEPQYIERIFDMYFRGNERSKGNGLGLYIVKKAVEKLNGHIVLKSEVGKGSCFTVSFPANQPHSEFFH